MMNNSIFEKAVAILGLENNGPRLVSALFSDGLWELEICTLTLVYDVFYDPETGEMPGISFEPAIDTGTSYARIIPVLGRTA